MNKFLTSLCFWIMASAGITSADPVSLGRFDFEQSSLPDWVDDQEKPGAVVDTPNPHGGKSSFHLDMGNRTGLSLRYRHAFNLPVLKDPRVRTVRLTLWVRAENVTPGELTLTFLSCYDQNRLSWYYPGYQNYTDNRFAVLPVSSEWTKVQVDGPVEPDVRDLLMYVRTGNQSGKAKVWIDDVSVDLLDRGLMFKPDTLGHIYGGEAATMTLHVAGADQLQSGAVRLFDEENRLVGTTDLKPGQSDVPVPLPSRGYYDVQAAAVYRDGTQSTTRTSAVVAGPNIPESLRRKSPFGLCGANDDLINLSGARWDRHFFSLRRDDYRQAAEAGFPANHVPATQAVVRADRDMVYCFCEQPDWFQDRQGRSPSSRYFPPKDWTRFPKFIRYVVQSIKDRPAWVEVANEPDDWGGSWPEFVRYAREMAQAVKAVNPRAKFLGPGFCNIDFSRIKPVVEAGLLDVVDVFSIHPYVSATPPEGDYIQRVRDLKAYLASVGRKNLPICLSEYGWTIPPGDWQRPVEPIVQARYVSRSSILLVAEQIDTFIYFLTLAGEGPTTSAAGYSLLNWDRTPRPGFAAFANAARMLTGVIGPGRCHQLTPTTWLALFRNNANTVAVAWDTAGPAGVLIPGTWKSARSMTGRPLTSSADGRIDVSPSPIFVEVTGLDLYRMNEIKTIKTPRGTIVPLAWKPQWMPAAMRQTDRGLQITEDATPGEYRIIGKTTEGWQVVKVLVQSVFEVDSVETLWPLSEPIPTLRARLRSNLEKPLETRVTWNLPGIKSSDPIRATLSQTAATVALPLADFVPGKRYQGRLVFESQKQTPTVRGHAPVDVTVIPCRPTTKVNDLPEMDFSDWSPFNHYYETVNPFTPADCSARLQIGYDDQGLRVRVTVTDDHHLQNQIPEDMWQEDSLQIAFDLDAEKPWIANVGGCNGHFKLFEYGFALAPSGPMTWRWISYDKSLPIDTEEKRIQMNLQRTGTQTIYNLLFPWPTLGVSAKPAPGSKIGLAVGVNDIDPEPLRHGLRLFNGIIEAKDPTKFGTVWLR